MNPSAMLHRSLGTFIGLLSGALLLVACTAQPGTVRPNVSAGETETEGPAASGEEEAPAAEAEGTSHARPLSPREVATTIGATERPRVGDRKPDETLLAVLTSYKGEICACADMECANVLGEKYLHRVAGLSSGTENGEAVSTLMHQITACIRGLDGR
jgi:hypothetical protein